MTDEAWVAILIVRVRLITGDGDGDDPARLRYRVTSLTDLDDPRTQAVSHVRTRRDLTRALHRWLDAIGAPRDPGPGS